MTTSKPEFHLQRITSDGAVGPVQLFPVQSLPTSTQMGRRGFLGAGLAVGGVLGLSGTRAAAAQNNTVVVYAHPKAVTSLAFSPDGKLLATASEETKVKIWALPGGGLRQVFGEQAGLVNGLVFSPDGKAIAAGSSDKLIRLLDLGGANMRFINAHTNWVTAVSYAPDGEMLASCSYDKLVKIWSLKTGKVLRTLEGHKKSVLTVAYAPNGRTLASGGQDDTVRLWDTAGGLGVRLLLGHTNWVACVAYSPDGRTLASASFDKTVRLWSVADGRPLRALHDHTDWVRGVAFTPDGSALVTGSKDKTVRVWNPKDGTVQRTLEGHAAPVQAVAVSPDGKYIASGDEDGTVIIWDLATGQRLWFLFDPKASRTDGNTYKVTDTVTGITTTYTLPCGSPVPAGATCTCNCVAGTYRAPVFVNLPPPTPEPYYQVPDYLPGGFGGGWGGYGGGYGGGGGGSYCSCNLICTCIPVCQAHRLLHADPVVRTLAEELLLVMGEPEFAYMRWAAEKAEPELRNRIRGVMTAIRNGAAADPARWPAVADCLPYLDDPDEVVGIMAAQAIALRGAAGPPRVQDLLDRAAERPWYVRAEV